jgi:hypothetical protein
MTEAPAAPRIFGIPAAEAPIVAVLRRGPTDWFHVGRWDTATPSFEPGAWFHGTLYPQKCDLSPDGRWLAYSAMKPGADWAAGDIYEAVSRLPWLTALAAWEAGTTYTRGLHFDSVAGRCDVGEPDVGDAGPIVRRYGIALNRPEQFSVERRRGWTESPSTAPRETGGVWDTRRNVEMCKVRPTRKDGTTLHVTGSYAGFREMPSYHDPAAYFLSQGDELVALDDVQWADWDAAGRLLVATTSGRLQIRALSRLEAQVVFEEDLSAMTPDPQPPPAWAEEW